MPARANWAERASGLPSSSTFSTAIAAGWISPARWARARPSRYGSERRLDANIPSAHQKLSQQRSLRRHSGATLQAASAESIFQRPVFMGSADFPHLDNDWRRRPRFGEALGSSDP